MTATGTIINQYLIDCPACGKPIDARISYKVSSGEPESDGTRTATLKPIGASVQHDCMPITVRGWSGTG